MKPGIGMQQAERAINTVHRVQLEIDGKLLTTPKPYFLARFRAKTITLTAASQGRGGGVRDEGKEPLILLMGITLMALLIACANVVNLLLARSAARTRGVTVRLALEGATQTSCCAIAA